MIGKTAAYQGPILAMSYRQRCHMNVIALIATLRPIAQKSEIDG